MLNIEGGGPLDQRQLLQCAFVLSMSYQVQLHTHIRCHGHCQDIARQASILTNLTNTAGGGEHSMANTTLPRYSGYHNVVERQEPDRFLPGAGNSIQLEPVSVNTPTHTYRQELHAGAHISFVRAPTPTPVPVAGTTLCNISCSSTFNTRALPPQDCTPGEGSPLPQQSN